jgi:hypothetical protein
MIHDDDLLDSIAVLALGALPEVEGRALATHVSTCEECLRAYREFRATADCVGYAAELEPAALDELAAKRLKAGIMRAVSASAQSGAARNGAVSESRTGARERPPWFGYALAAAAALVAALAGVDDAGLHAGAARDRAQIAALQARAAAQDARLALVLDSGNTRYAVPGGMVLRTRDARIVLAMTHMPAPPAGKVYQAWTLARGAKTVAPSITFTPASDGVAVVELPQSATTVVAVAVTLEPAGGSKTPTSKPAFVRPLS